MFTPKAMAGLLSSALLLSLVVALSARAVTPDKLPSPLPRNPGEFYAASLKVYAKHLLFNPNDPGAGGPTFLIEITRDPESGPAKDAGLEKGDMIQEVAGQPIRLPAPGDHFDLRATGNPTLLVWDHETHQRVPLPVRIP